MVSLAPPVGVTGRFVDRLPEGKRPQGYYAYNGLVVFFSAILFVPQAGK